MLEQELVNESQDEHIDNSEESSDIVEETPTEKPAEPSVVDVRQLYAESARLRQQQEQELLQLRQQLASLQKPAVQEEEEDLTDDDIEKYGTTGTIKRIVAQTLRKELSNQLGEVREFSGEFKKNKQLASAEASFYSQFPHLAQWKDTLSPLVRQQLQNAPSVDPQTYAMQAMAVIGYHTALNASASTNTNTQPKEESVNPPRNMPPNRSNGAPTPTNRSTPRLTELERRGMRQMNLDPNKKEDVESFLSAINNDEGVFV